MQTRIENTKWFQEHMILDTKMNCYDMLVNRMISLESKTIAEIYSEYRNKFKDSDVYFEGNVFKISDVSFDIFCECFVSACRNYYLTFRTGDQKILRDIDKLLEYF